MSGGGHRRNCHSICAPNSVRVTACGPLGRQEDTYS